MYSRASFSPATVITLVRDIIEVLNLHAAGIFNFKWPHLLVIQNWLLFRPFANVFYQPKQRTIFVFFLRKFVIIIILWLIFRNFNIRGEKWIFENFRGPFYDDVIYRDDPFLWSKEELKIKAKEIFGCKSLPTAWGRGLKTHRTSTDY